MCYFHSLPPSSRPFPCSLSHDCFFLRASSVLVTASCHFLVADVILEKGTSGSLDEGVPPEGNNRVIVRCDQLSFRLFASCIYGQANVQVLEPPLQQAFVPRFNSGQIGSIFLGTCWQSQVCVGTQRLLLNSTKRPQGLLPVSSEAQPAFHFLTLQEDLGYFSFVASRPLPYSWIGLMASCLPRQ